MVYCWPETNPARMKSSAGEAPTARPSTSISVWNTSAASQARRTMGTAVPSSEIWTLSVGVKFSTSGICSLASVSLPHGPRP